MENPTSSHIPPPDDSSNDETSNRHKVVSGFDSTDLYTLGYFTHYFPQRRSHRKRINEVGVRRDKYKRRSETGSSVSENVTTKSTSH